MRIQCIYMRMNTTSIQQNTRRDAIRQILETQKIGNQEELRLQLIDKGFETTQATLSRDLTALRVNKILDEEHGYIYSLSTQPIADTHTVEEQAILQAWRSIDYSQNIAVIKCLPSFASSIAYLIDGLQLKEVVGTVAGDDTVMIILRQGMSPDQFAAAMRKHLPAVRHRI